MAVRLFFLIAFLFSLFGCAQSPLLLDSHEPLPDEQSAGRQSLGNAEDIRTEKTALATGIYRIECLGPRDDVLLVHYLDDSGRPLNGTYYVFLCDSELDRSSVPNDWIPSLLSPSVFWSRRQAAEDAQYVSEYVKTVFEDGLLKSSEYHRHTWAPAYVLEEMNSHGTVRRVTFFGESAKGIEVIIYPPRPPLREDEQDRMFVTIIGQTGFAVREESYKGGKLVQARDIDGPLDNVTVEPLSQGGWKVRGKIRRNCRKRYPARFDFVAELDAEFGIRSIRGTFFYHGWRRYGYFEDYGAERSEEFLVRIEKSSGLGRSELATHLRRYVHEEVEVDSAESSTEPQQQAADAQPRR